MQHFTCSEKENLVKHQKVSKFYEIDCLENFILLFSSLLIVQIHRTVTFGQEFNLFF